jgi:hypothetical protein
MTERMEPLEDDTWCMLRKITKQFVDDVFDETGKKLDYDEVLKFAFESYINEAGRQTEIELDNLIRKDPKVADQWKEYSRRHGLSDEE